VTRMGEGIGSYSVCVRKLEGKSRIERSRRRWENINLLTPNVNYSGLTAPLTSKIAFYIFIQQI